MFGPLGYELDLFHLSETEKQAIKSQIVFYKKQRQLLTFGTFYQLQQLDHANETTWAAYDPQNEEALIAFFSRAGTSQSDGGRLFARSLS